MTGRHSGYMPRDDVEGTEMPQLHRFATFGLLGVLALGCTQTPPLGSAGNLPPASLPTPRPTATPVPTPTPPPREILPFHTGDHFAFNLYLLSVVQVGTLALDIQRVGYADGVETIDLTIGVGASVEAHRIVLKEGMFHYDDKPFVPDHMQIGQSWPAQDGVAGVTNVEGVEVPADYYPHCYRVLFQNPKGEQLVLWFASGVGLVKGTFKLAAFGEGRIELKARPTNLQAGL